MKLPAFEFMLLASLTTVLGQLPIDLEPAFVGKAVDTSSDPNVLVFANPAMPNPADIGLRIMIDQPVFSMDGEEQLGILEGVSTMIGFTMEGFPKFTTSYVIDFGNENIVAAQGATIADFNPETDGVIPIVGGTGIYDGATGWVTQQEAADGFIGIQMYLTNLGPDGTVEKCARRMN